MATYYTCAICGLQRRTRESIEVHQIRTRHRGILTEVEGGEPCEQCGITDGAIDPATGVSAVVKRTACGCTMCAMCYAAHPRHERERMVMERTRTGVRFRAAVTRR